MKLPRTINSENELRELIRSLHNTHNIYVPPVVFYNNHMTLVPAEVHLDSKWGQGYKNDDIWTIDGTNFNLTKVAMSKLSSASGVVYFDSRIAYRELDPVTKRVTYIKHSVAWRKADLSGVDITGISTGEYSYYEDEARYRYKKDITSNGNVIHKKGEPIIEQIERRRNYAGSLAETNAKVRAFSEAVCEIPKSFTLEELKKPFLLVRAVANVQHILNQHPELQPVYGAQILGIANVIYGTPQTQNNQILVAPQPPQIGTTQVESQLALPEVETKPEQNYSDSVTAQKLEVLTEAQMNKMTKEDLVKHSKLYMAKIGYTPKTPPEKMDDDKIKLFIMFLQEEAKKL